MESRLKAIWNSLTHSSPSSPHPPTTLIFLAIIFYSLSTLVSMAVMSIGTGVLLGATLWFVFSLARPTSTLFNHQPELQNPQIKNLFQTSCCLIGACLVSLIMAKLHPLQFAGQSARVELLADMLKAWYFFLPFWLLILFSQLPKTQHQKIIQVWLSFAGLLSILAVIQFFTGFPRRQEIPTLVGRFHATLFFGHHLSTASILIFPFFVALSAAASQSTSRFIPSLSNRPNWPSRYLSILLPLLIGIALFLTWSRTLWVALPIGIFVWCIRKLRAKQLFAMGFLLLLIGFCSTQFSPVRARIENAMGIQPRIELWKANWYFFEQRPFFGVGWRKGQGLMGAYFEEKYPIDASHRFVGHAHNNFLEMLSGIGLIGTAIWIYWNFLVLKMALQVSRRKDFFGDVGWGLFCAWIVFHLNGLTQVNFWEGKVLHQMMWSTSLLFLCLNAPLRDQNHVLLSNEASLA